MRLTNRYGTQPVTIGEARVALRTAGSEVDPASDRELRFEGATGVAIPAGEEVLSDPVDLTVVAGDDLALSLFLPRDTGLATYLAVPLETGFVARGNAASAPSLPGPEEVDARYLVAGVDVLAPVGTRIAVAFGDSWLEGHATTSDTNRRPTNVLTPGWSGAGSSTRASAATACSSTCRGSTAWLASTATCSPCPASPTCSSTSASTTWACPASPASPRPGPRT